MVPGLTTELLEPFADRIMVGFESCRRYYQHPDKIVVTGTPVRGDFFALTRQEAKAKLGVDDGRPLIVSFWGSLGASGMDYAGRFTVELAYGADYAYKLQNLQAVIGKLESNETGTISLRVDGKANFIPGK